MSEHYAPKGISFWDARSERLMLLVTEGGFAGWLCYRGAEGQWVTLRQATEEDRQAIGARLGGTSHDH